MLPQNVMQLDHFHMTHGMLGQNEIWFYGAINKQ